MYRVPRTAYRRTGPSGLPLALRLSEGLDSTARITSVTFAGSCGLTLHLFDVAARVYGFLIHLSQWLIRCRKTLHRGSGNAGGS